MANAYTNRQASLSTERFITNSDSLGTLDWGDLLSTHNYSGFDVVKVFSATCNGACYSKGGPAEWLTIINGEVVGDEPTKRRAKLIGDAIRDGHIESTGDTGARLESYLTSMIIWDYKGIPATDEQRREIDSWD